MKIFVLFVFSILLIVFPATSQSSDTSSSLNFISYQNLTTYFDSLGKFEMTIGWEKATEKIMIDAFGNRIKLRNLDDGTERLFVMGVRGKKYQSSGELYIIPFYQCTDDREKRCTIRLMLQDSENITKHPSYLYVDYAATTYVYQLFWDTEIIENYNNKKTNDGSTIKQLKQGCLFLSDSFVNINSALEEIENTRFTFHDTYYSDAFNISKASYYACERKDGHLSVSLLIIKDKDKDYIFQNVPKNVWSAFKKAKSADVYYEKNIKNNYKNVLN